MKVLILGGTSFLGPHLVQELQQNGHEVTIFTRGNQRVELSQVEQLHGDRDGNLESLKGRNWDAVIDTSGYLPRVVRDSSEILAASAKHYTFISSISVYRDFQEQKIDESYPLAKLDDEDNEEITDKTYGALKAACEQVALNYFANRCLIIRPGLIVGPLDPTDRFSYWPIRIKKGGEVLAPGSPTQLLQFIDVRDLAHWIVAMVEQRATGIYHATGPADPLTFEELLHACQTASGTQSDLTWASEDFLINHNIQDWTELPLWLSSRRNMPGFLNVNVDKAVQAGLKFRPLSETLNAILDWDERRGKKERIGLDPEKEQTLLNLWKEEVNHS
ncbi:MAG: SDR family oxidoreductase [Verrucomicrobia bacterium]|nr:SDR family oxidoreductase [Verrucomicrobiota bacterium]